MRMTHHASVLSSAGTKSRTPGHVGDIVCASVCPCGHDGGQHRSDLDGGARFYLDTENRDAWTVARWPDELIRHKPRTSHDVIIVFGGN